MIPPRTPIPREALFALAALVEMQSGLHFADSRQAELTHKAERAFADSGCTTWDDYLARLVAPAGRKLLDQLVEALTVGETYFFRDRPTFDALERVVLPDLLAWRQATRQIRCWCAGCATGEEAYSLAILLRRVLSDNAGWPVSLLATDLNRHFLARAEAGLYGDWSFREPDEHFRAVYFERDGKRYRIRPELRRLVRFGYLNLADESYPSPANGTVDLDLIFCRNVLMYFAPPLIGRIVERLRAALVPGGWLVLGPSDPLPGLLAGFEMHAIEGAVLYRRIRDDPAPLALRPAPPVLGEGPNGVSTAPANAVSVAPSWVASPPTPVTATQVPALAAMPREPVRTEQGWSHVAPQPEARGGSVTAAADWREFWQSARLSADRRDLTEAEARCRQAIALATLRPEPYYLFGLIQQARDRDDEALKAFRQALYADNAFVPAHLAMAALHRRAGRVAQARQTLARARRLLQAKAADDLILAEDGLTAGRLRAALEHAIATLDKED